MPQPTAYASYISLSGSDRDKDSLRLFLLLRDRDGEEDGHGGGPIDSLCSARVGIAAGGDGLNRWGSVVGDGDEDEACWVGQ